MPRVRCGHITGRHERAERRPCGHVNILKILLNHEGPIVINHVDQMGRSALHCACQAGRLEVVQIQMGSGANPDLRNGDDKTAGQVAEAGQLEQRGTGLVEQRIGRRRGHLCI